MSKLSSISSIDSTSLELLEAAGFYEIVAIAKSSTDGLTAELEKAHSVLRIGDRPPSRESVEQWIGIARGMVGFKEDPVPVLVASAAVESVVYVLSPSEQQMVEKAPHALPLPPQLLISQKLTVAEIPEGNLFAKQRGQGTPVEKGGTSPSKISIRPIELAVGAAFSDPSAPRTGLDMSRLRSTGEMSGPVPMQSSAAVEELRPSVSLIRAPLKETNEGRNIESNFYIRGVLHNRPWGIAVGACLSLVIAVLIPISVVSTVLLLLSQEVPEGFVWVPKWILVFPASLPVVGIFYLIMGMRCNCRICGQKLFLPKLCLKSSKAHHVFGLGYIIPTAVFLLIFRWFRCIYCGTPVRLKQ
ncbi:MAG: DUF4332 domain-containing protein [Akkermansiaceae bacterium]|nr:DUF4332 domain-containing protein [Akkermansiaceae bacterium]